MIATMNIRWRSATDEEEEITVCAPIPRKHAECSPEYFVLEQEWKTAEGDSVWILVPMGY